MEVENQAFSFSVLWEHGWFIISVTAIFVLVAFVVLHVYPRQWESSAIVRLAQVGKAGAVGQWGDPVEPAARASFRLQLADFQQKVLKRVGLQDDGPDAELLRTSLLVEPLSSADFIQISLRAFSPARARELLMAIVEDLRRDHAEMVAPTITRLQGELKHVAGAQTALAAEGERLRAILKNIREADDHSLDQAIVTSVLLAQNQQQIQALQQQHSSLLERLAPERTYPTTIVGSIQISKNFVAPRPVLILLDAALCGAIVGGISAFGWCHWRFLPRRKVGHESPDGPRM